MAAYIHNAKAHIAFCFFGYCLHFSCQFFFTLFDLLFFFHSLLRFLPRGLNLNLCRIVRNAKKKKSFRCRHTGFSYIICKVKRMSKCVCHRKSRVCVCACAELCVLFRFEIYSESEDITSIPRSLTSFSFCIYLCVFHRVHHNSMLSKHAVKYILYLYTLPMSLLLLFG